MSTRIDGRSLSDPRPISIELGLQKNPAGSVLYRCGATLVMISASVSEGAPDWIRESGAGWVTAEYVMHPCANPRRQRREGGGKVSGRSKEITRLIGRSLRAAVDMKRLGERTITIDCDVLDADGGTRTASISGAFVALTLAVDELRKKGLVPDGVIRKPVAAISVGFVDNKAMLDLCYEEDHRARVDLNIVGTETGELIEVQGTAEGEPIARADFDTMLDLGLASMAEITAAQRAALTQADVPVDRLFQ
jgi:ribonuclease PH